MAITASKMGAMQPLPLAPSGSVHVASGVDFLEDAEGNGSVFLWGMAAWCWGAGDTTARRLAAVQLVGSKAARQRQVADAFGVHENSLVRWRSAYRAGGASALATDRPGPRDPSKLTEAKRAEIAALRASGLSLAAVASRTGVSTDTVRRATVMPAPPRVPGAQPEDGPTAGPEDAARLVPLASPLDRGGERALARFRMINDAPPVICEGASLPLVGTVLILPALAATGLLEIAARDYGARGAAFYSPRSLVCSIVFAYLLGEPRAEGFSRLSPKDLGRLVGLDRGPEVTTIRRRIEELAQTGRPTSCSTAWLATTPTPKAKRPGFSTSTVTCAPTTAGARCPRPTWPASAWPCALGGRRTDTEIAQAFGDAQAEIERLAQAAKAIPTRVPLGLVRPQAVRMTPERKRIHDVIRMATYNAESALARLLAPHYARADDEARSLLREAFGAPADLEVVGNELHVRLVPLSAPRRTADIAGLCQDLTATKTIYPGTELTLV